MINHNTYLQLKDILGDITLITSNNDISLYTINDDTLQLPSNIAMVLTRKAKDNGTVKEIEHTYRRLGLTPPNITEEQLNENYYLYRFKR